MFYIILFVVVGYLIFFKLLPAVSEKLEDAFAFICYYVICGPAIYITKFILFISNKLKLKWLAALATFYGVYKFLFFIHPKTIEKYGTSLYICGAIMAALALVLFINHTFRLFGQFRYRKVITYNEINVNRFHPIICAPLLFFEGLVIYQLSSLVFFSYAFSAMALGYLIYSLVINILTNHYRNKFKKNSLNRLYFNTEGLKAELKIPDSYREECEREVVKLVYRNIVKELKLGNTTVFINTKYFSEIKQIISVFFHQEFRAPKDEFIEVFRQQCLNLSAPLLEDFIKFYIDDVNLYEFDDNEYYVGDFHKNDIVICSCCGKAKLASECSKIEGEYYCSDLCRETEETCSMMMGAPSYIQAKEKVTNINRGMATGAAVWGTGQYWANHVKMFHYTYKKENGQIVYDQKTGKPVIIGPKGHGFAAEDANNIIDKFHFKNAHVVGGDNRANGADRIVNGELLQSKYCANPAKTVNSAFTKEVNNQTINVDYKYINEQTGKPMILEVPKDQYEQCIKEMEQKIREGRVPGVTDPAEAQNLIRKGNITYNQAVNITKFGRIESILYDSAHGLVIAGSTAGISFAISTAIYYWKTKDFKLAMRTALVESLKTGGKTFATFVLSAQLQKIPALNHFLDESIKVNFTNSKSGKYVAERMARKTYSGKFVKGKELNKSANHSLRGTVTGAVVSSVATITVQSVCELILFARRRISGMQCVKNIIVGAGGVTGGTVGGILGGILLAPIPVVGPTLGSIVGGSIGGFVGGMGTKKIMDNFIKDDSEFIMYLITRYVEWISIEFFLSQDEIYMLSDELDGYISSNKNILQKVHASRNRRSLIASFIKPMVVNIVRHRDCVTEDDFTNVNLKEVVKGA